MVVIEGRCKRIRGRQMNAHFATPLIDESGNWLDTRNKYNVSSDIAPTAGQMARALGLALASKKYRENQNLNEHGTKLVISLYI